MNIVMTVRSSCELETYIVAVERIKEYTELPSEVSQISLISFGISENFSFYQDSGLSRFLHFVLAVTDVMLCL